LPERLSGLVYIPDSVDFLEFSADFEEGRGHTLMFGRESKLEEMCTSTSPCFLLVSSRSVKLFRSAMDFRELPQQNIRVHVMSWSPEDSHVDFAPHADMVFRSDYGDESVERSRHGGALRSSIAVVPYWFFPPSEGLPDPSPDRTLDLSASLGIPWLDCGSNLRVISKSTFRACACESSFRIELSPDSPRGTGSEAPRICMPTNC
jgi:hypothetical protein